MIWPDNARILAIYAVVLLHVSAGLVVGNTIGSEYWWIGNVYDSAVRWCVPIFVMISGALLLDSEKKESLTTFYNKRLSRILIPIITWSSFFLTWTAFKSHLLGQEIAPIHLMTRLLSGKPYFHMWFLYMILSLYFFTPFFRKIVSNSSKHELTILIVAAFLMSSLTYAHGQFFSKATGLFVNSFLMYVPFFFIGYLIRLDERTPSKVLLWMVFVVSIALTFSGCYVLAINADLDAGLYFYGYLSVTVIPMSISLMYILKTWDTPIISASVTKKTSMLTLGIYLIHPVFLELVNYIGYGANNNYHPVVGVPLVASVVFLTSMATAWIISHLPYARRVI